ncbi:TPR repeat-containing protein MJ1345 [Frankliniella fusca]|uniref:TPR repeat-containing protein MJ1345 n=1 Tax=Frankliniella fusca TaxID=407009 RepID=A0AAE1HWV3_9NEOP|nr:TPR repeat-containing protein MJ1345 [Frankliniella fusca]
MATYKQPKAFKVRRLQCPFTWKIPKERSRHELTREKDTLVLAPNPWTVVLSKLFLAYQYAMWDDIEESKRQLVECYLPLVALEVKGLVRDDIDLVNDYKIGLKHVIDSSWAFVSCNKKGLDIEPFLDSITPHSTMSDTQKAAVWAIRSKLIRHEGSLSLTAIETAITLNPNEGQWYLYKAQLLHLSELEEEAFRALQVAYLHRQSAEITIVYAIAFIEYQLRKREEIKPGLEILREAVTKWPKSSYVYFECGVALHKYQSKLDDIEEAAFRLRNSPELGKSIIRKILDS